MASIPVVESAKQDGEVVIVIAVIIILQRESEGIEILSGCYLVPAYVYFTCFDLEKKPI